MKTIWKYEVKPWGIFRLRMPTDAKVLSVGRKPEGVFLWALVDPNEPEVERAFYSAATGEELPPKVDENRYIGTFQVPANSDPDYPTLVFHLFEFGE